MKSEKEFKREFEVAKNAVAKCRKRFNESARALEQAIAFMSQTFHAWQKVLQTKKDGE